MIRPKRIPNHVKIGLLCSGFMILNLCLGLADEALLQAKRAGRNRIELSVTPAKELTVLQKKAQPRANSEKRKAS